MPRLTREQNRQLDQIQRQVVTLKPQTISGGFFPLAALAPFAAAAGIPLLSSAGKWIGQKIFGKGVRQAGAGILRSGERIPMRGGAISAFRAGDMKMPSMMPMMNYKTGTMTGMQGGFIANLPDSIVPAKVKTAVKLLSTVGGKKKASRKRKC